MASRRRTRKKRRRRGGGSLNVKFAIEPVSTDGGVPLFNKSQFTEDLPAVSWSPPSSGYYTFMCVDPDSSEPEWLHWLVTNCKGADPSTGTPVVPWNPPAPAVGTHRYYFKLYSHANPISATAPKSRSAFNSGMFVSANRLVPVGQTMIKVASNKD